MKYVGARHQAGAGDGTHISNHVRKIKIVMGVASQSLECMPTTAENTHDYPRVLDSAVRVQQFGAYHAHLRPDCHLYHGREPAWGNHGSIVIQKKKNRGVASAGSLIVNGGVIELMLAPIDVSQRQSRAGPRGDQFLDLAFLRVVYDDNLGVPILGFGEHALQIVAENIDLTAR